MAVGDICGMRIVGRYQQQNIVNHMAFKILTQTSDDHDVLNDMCLAWETQHKTSWLGMHSNAYSLMGLKGYSLSGANKRPGLVHIDDPGTVTGSGAPSVLCRTVTLYTDSDNYRRRGRIMLSGSVDLDFDDADGSVTDATLAFMLAFGVGLIVTLAGGGQEWEPGLQPQGVLPWEPFVAAQGRKTPATIRSRRIRGFSIG